MKIYYDTEFIENGETIRLISIGMVAEDGRELYLINRNAPLDRITESGWLIDNVVPSLPLSMDEQGRLTWNVLHSDWQYVTDRANIARLVERFVLAEPDPQLWAWYGAYDHVVLCQLWGQMIALPTGIPMWTNDLKQECERLGNPFLPEQEAGNHNVLADARHNRIRANFLAQAADK